MPPTPHLTPAGRPRIRRLSRILLAAVAAATAAASAAQARPAEPDVPPAIRVPAGNKLFLLAHAEGVQVFRCDPRPDGQAWTFVGPWATLRDDRGRLVGTHFSGPTWRARDGSEVVGRRVDGVTVDPQAVPWLLLERASSRAGIDGRRLVDTTYIQRINTTGGLEPPAAACNPSTLHRWVEVPYSADYAFWKARGN